jgi:hypothetical protein
MVAAGRDGLERSSLGPADPKIRRSRADLAKDLNPVDLMAARGTMAMRHRLVSSSLFADGSSHSAGRRALQSQAEGRAVDSACPGRE